MHFKLSVPLALFLALPIISSTPTAKRQEATASNEKNAPCAVPPIAFTAFDYVFQLEASNQREQSVDDKRVRLLRTPPDPFEVTPVLGNVGDLMDFGFGNGHLSIIGGRRAYSLPTIAIFPPVLVPFRLNFTDSPISFTASYVCDKRGNLTLVLKPDGADGRAVAFGR